MSYEYFSHNGKLLPMSEAVVPLANINFQYGFGVYESLKVRNKILYFAPQHIDRLFNSAKIIELHHPFEKDRIEEYISEIIAKNGIESANIKMLLLGGRTPQESDLYILPLAPLYPDRKLYSDGAHVSSVVYERFMPGAKTLNMLPSFHYYTKAKQNNNYDVLFLDKAKNILEGSRTNFFALKDEFLYTAPAEFVLEGVTKMTVISTALKNGLQLKEQLIPLDSLSQFDGAFLTSTSSKIIPLKKINDFEFPSIHPKIKDLMKYYDKFLDQSRGIFETQN